MLQALLAALLLLPISVAMPERNQRQTEGKKMAPSDVVTNVKRKNWDIVEQPGTVGPDAVPALLPLLSDPDNQIRELTVQCLAMAGGPAAVEGLMKALNDRIETISAAAVRGLARHAGPGEVPALTAQMASNNNEYVREQIALLLGRTGDAANIRPLAARKPLEKDAGARHAMSLAMARLGDVPSKDELRGRLRANDAAMRVAALRDLPYVNDRALLADAAPLLADERPGLNIGPSHGPYFIRVCDVVVLVTAEMLGNVFTFEVSRRRFTPEELAAARKVLTGLR
jgi:HEAT repeat protein